MKALRNSSRKDIKVQPEKVFSGRRFQQTSSWNIAIALTIAILAYILLRTFDNQPEVEKKPREIPNPQHKLPPSQAEVHTFQRSAVSSDSQVCSKIGSGFINANIFDATIAISFCLALTQCASTGLLGGFLATVYHKRTSFVIDAQVVAPKNFNSDIKNVSSGSLSVAVPGFLQGLWEIHQKHGTLPWRSLVDPTIELCREGFFVSHHLHNSMSINERILNDKYLKETLYDQKDKRFKRPGSKIVFNKICDFLEVVAGHSTGSIIEGKVGEMIAKDLEDAGTLITIGDLKSYKVKWTKSIKFPLKGYELLLPNTGAVLVPVALNILNQFKLNASSFNDENMTQTYHRIAEALKHVFAARAHLGDPDYVDVTKVMQNLLSAEYAETTAKKIDSAKTFSDPAEYDCSYATPDDHGTSHFSIIAANGDAISFTSSINYYFGSGQTGMRTGLVFNNGMDDFSYKTRDVNYFGLKETPTNYPEPRKRALSSMSPVIVVDKLTGEAKLAVGAAGGSRIVSALVVLLQRFICCTQDIKELVDAPRIHHQLVPNVLEYEYGITDRVVKGLEALGHKTERFINRASIVNGVVSDTLGIHAIADHRKDGSGVAGA